MGELIMGGFCWLEGQIAVSSFFVQTSLVGFQVLINQQQQIFRKFVFRSTELFWGSIFSDMFQSTCWTLFGPISILDKF